MEVHVLNGDALKEKFPKSIEGDIIIARECLVDGDVSGKNLSELYLHRQIFLKEAYGISPDEYQKTIQEFDKITNIDSDSVVNLWFEDDLFCQVNLWFCAYLLMRSGLTDKIFLVRPNTDLRYGFGGMDEDALISAYENKYEILPENLSVFSQLWRGFQSNKTAEMLKIVNTIDSKFSFIQDAVIAFIESIPTHQSPGRPKKALIDIMKRLGTESFGPVFREFSKSESIYGFGDLQVKRLLKDLIKP